MVMELVFTKRLRFKIQQVNARQVLAYAASLMLTTVPPAVCESALSEVYSSVKKSLSGIIG